MIYDNIYNIVIISSNHCNSVWALH